MKELWDIYNRDKVSIGMIKERGSVLENGEFYLVALVWIRGSNDKYLISRRTQNLSGAGLWQTTGGCVLSGETSVEGAIRETREEIGLNFVTKQMRMIRSKPVGSLSGWIADYWHVCDDINIDMVVCQEDEVSEVKWATVDEIEELIESNQFFHGELHLDFMTELRSIT